MMLIHLFAWNFRELCFWKQASQSYYFLTYCPTSLLFHIVICFLHFYSFIHLLVNLEECFALVTHESPKRRGEQAIRWVVNDVMSAEHCKRALYSWLLFVIVHQVAGTTIHHELVSLASATCAQGNWVDKGCKVKRCTSNVTKFWSSLRCVLSALI